MRGGLVAVGDRRLGGGHGPGRGRLERRAREDRTTAEELRAKLTQVRWEAAQERAALRQEAREQLDAILARFSATPDPDTGTSAPPAHEDQAEETERHG